MRPDYPGLSPELVPYVPLVPGRRGRPGARGGRRGPAGLEAGAEAFADTVDGVDRVTGAVCAAQRAPVMAEELEVVDREQAELMADVLAALGLEGHIKTAIAGGDVPGRKGISRGRREGDVGQRLARPRRPDAGLFLFAGRRGPGGEVRADGAAAGLPGERPPQPVGPVREE